MTKAECFRVAILAVYKFFCLLLCWPSHRSYNQSQVTAIRLAKSFDADQSPLLNVFGARICSKKINRSTFVTQRAAPFFSCKSLFPPFQYPSNQLSHLYSRNDLIYSFHTQIFRRIHGSMFLETGSYKQC